MKNFLDEFTESFSEELKDQGTTRFAKAWNIVSLAHETKADPEDDERVLYVEGQYHYRQRLDQPEDENAPQYKVGEETFAPTKAFPFVVFSFNKERIKFDPTNRSKVMCFSKDTKYPDKDNPFSDNCAGCPLSQFGLDSQTRCNIVPVILGLDRYMRPTVVQLGMSSLKAFRQFCVDMDEVSRKSKERGTTWVPFCAPMVLKSMKVPDSTYKVFTAVFPTVDEMLAMTPLSDEKLQKIYNTLYPIREMWHPKYMPEGQRVLGHYVAAGSSAPIESVPERKAIGQAPAGGRTFKREPVTVDDDDDMFAGE